LDFGKTPSIILFTLRHIDDIDKSINTFNHDYVIRNGLWHAGILALLVQPSLTFLPDTAGPSAPLPATGRERERGRAHSLSLKRQGDVLEIQCS
jgi:hypothetical protein